MGKATYNQIMRSFRRQKNLNGAYAKEGPLDLVVVLDHLSPDYNIGKIFRSSEAFGVRKVCLVGIPFFNPGPSKGCFRKVKADFFDDMLECIEALVADGYELVMLSPHAKKTLREADLPKKTAFILGAEERGHSFDPSQFKNVHEVKIQQFGQVESLNVSVAATLAMYEYTNQIKVQPTL